MQRTKNAFRLLLAIGVCLVVVPWVQASPEEQPMVSLRWALGALTVDGDTPNAINKDAQLDSGARLKFLVEPLSAGSVYLILLDSSEELHVLYRESNLLNSTDPTYIPSGSHWFELDNNKGMETFFLLASAERLTALESMLDRYESAKADRAAVVAEVVTEIRRLHKANRDLARPVEKPVMIGGQTRGGPVPQSVIDRLAVEIQAEGFYGKTITIDH